jgi:cytosine/adenosine deaminase-related metal-dependent hydrolase
VKTLFVHTSQAKEEEFLKIAAQKNSIVHCPVSNRLLGCGKLDLELPKKYHIPLLVATDGLSSNFSLSLFNELRSALMMQSGLDVHLLSRDLLRGVTTLAAQALDLNNGELSVGKDADIIIFRLPGVVKDEKHLPLQVILHTNEVETIYINGEELGKL